MGIFITGGCFKTKFQTPHGFDFEEVYVHFIKTKSNTVLLNPSSGLRDCRQDSQNFSTPWRKSLLLLPSLPH
jgi:hypothetical protein